MLRVSFALNNSAFSPLNKRSCYWLIVDIPFLEIHWKKYLFLFNLLSFTLKKIHAEIGNKRLHVCEIIYLSLFYYST